MVDQINAKNDQINTITTDTKVAEGKLVMDAMVKACTPPNDPNGPSCRYVQTELNSAANSFSARTPDAGGTLRSYAEYSNASVIIAQEVANVQAYVGGTAGSAVHDALIAPFSGSSSIANQRAASLERIDATVNAYVTQPYVNPALATQLKTAQSQAHDTINSTHY